MRYLSVFSGVEAASVAWEPLGWVPVAFSEVDGHASEVLAKRFPNVPNLGDITKVDWKEFNARYGAVDVVVGGSPCQSFSIAGNREGLEGESRLMFEYIRCIREVRPRYFVWENVPGCLSSGPEGQKGGDFRCLLGELDELGYGLAWRVFDAQFARVPGGPRLGFFGPVAQRRRRVFLVGSLGSVGAAEILFERSCLRGNHPKGAKAREALAGDPAEGPAVRHSAGFKYHAGKRAGSIGFEVGTSPTLTADYHNPAVLTPRDVQSKRAYMPEGTSPTLPSGSGQGMTIHPIVLQGGGTTSLNSHGSGIETDGACYTLNNIDRHAVAFAQNTRDEVRLFGGDGKTVGALSAQPGMKQTSYVMTQYGSTAGGARHDQSPCADRGQDVVVMQDGQANGTVTEDGTSTTLNASHENPIVCMADDNGKSAVETDMSGSLKVGGCAPGCDGERVVGALCARDYKGVGTQFVRDGKVVVQKKPPA